MRRGSFGIASCVGTAVMLLAAVGGGGCAPPELSYQDLRTMGSRQMIRRDYGTARNLFVEAMTKVPEDAWNLYDLGDCSIYLAKEQFHRRNIPAAMNYVDDAVDYYSRSINAHPGMEPALWGKNMALELRKQFEEALKVAQWAAEFVGPSAKQQVFLAHEMEERNDLDAALLRYQQAITMEPGNAYARAEMGRFLARIDRKPEAIQHLRAAYRLNPVEPGVVEALRELDAWP